MALLQARRWWFVPGAVVLGVAVGVIVSLLGSTSRRAEAAVLVSSPRGPSAVKPFLPNLRELATSSVLAGNVRATLRLQSSVEDIRDRLDASIRPDTQVIVLAATDAHGDQARQLTQESALVFAQLVANRFAHAKPPLQAAVLDSAHTLSGPERHFLRNAFIGAAVGLLLGSAAAMLLGGGGVGADGDLRRRETELARRVHAVTARERELAARVGMLAARERELEARDVVEAEAPAAVAGSNATGGWNVDRLASLVEAHASAAPDKREEWEAYLFFLRQHAEADGSLPSQFDDLVNDVFGDVIR
jgi:hypothetical protein